jgi:predicted dehydrogenase
VVASGRLGKITLVRATWDTSTALGAWLVPFPPDSSPDSIDYAAFAGAAREFDPARFFRWRCYRAFGSGLAGARLAPQLTAIHWLLGASQPSRTSAAGALLRWKDGREVPDTMHAALEYPDGFTVVLSATQAGGSDRELRITGTAGTVSIDDRGFWIDDDPHAEPYSDVAESWPKEYRDWFYMMHGMTPLGQVRGTPSPEPSRVRYEAPQAVSATMAHLADFVDAVRTRRAPRETAELAAGAAAAAIAIDSAARVPAKEQR